MPDCQVARLGREEAVSGRLYRREDARQDGAVGVVDASSTRYEVCAPLEPVPIEDGGAVPVDVKADRSWIVVVSRPDNVGDGISRPRARKHPCRVLQRVARVLDVQMYLARQERRECGQERVQVAHHARVHQPVEGRYSRAPREPIPLDTCSIEGGHFASNQSLYRPEQQSADLAALGLNPMGVGASIEILPPLRNTPRGYGPGGYCAGGVESQSRPQPPWDSGRAQRGPPIAVLVCISSDWMQSDHPLSNTCPVEWVPWEPWSIDLLRAGGHGHGGQPAHVPDRTHVAPA